jgi:O-acetylserine/cysteine efflux transporter
MRLSHVALCLLACLLWSGNFIAVKLGLDAHLTPFLLTALRFALASCLIPFVPRPAGVSWFALALIGIVIGVGQYGGASLSVAAGLSPAITALILQTQALLTVGLARGFLREALSRRVVAGCVLALLGMGMLVKAGGGATMPVLSASGLIFAFAAAFSAGAGNILMKRCAGRGNALHLAIWISPFPILPLTALSLWAEPSPLQTLQHVDYFASGAVIAYGALVSSIGGTAIWAWLLKRHPAGQVALFSPAVPIFAFGLSAAFFGDTPNAHQVAATALVVLGLLVASARFRLPRATRLWLAPGPAAR